MIDPSPHTENRTPKAYLFGPKARQALLLAYLSAPPDTVLRLAVGTIREAGALDDGEVIIAVTLGSLRVALPAHDARLMAQITEDDLDDEDDPPPSLAQRLTGLVAALRYAADRADEVQATRRDKPH